MNANPDRERRLRFDREPMIKAMQLFEHRQRAAYYRSRALFEILVRPTERHQTVTGKVAIVSSGFLYDVRQHAEQRVQ